MSTSILDEFGRPMQRSQQRVSREALAKRFMQRMIRAKYDAAQTWHGNEDHWRNADALDPHAVASPEVRKKLRSRSRYEVMENNPYLKGAILSIANDFVGRGPKLQVVDRRLSKDRRQAIEARWQQWARRTKQRKKLWRARMAKIVDGEAILRAYTADLRMPVSLNFQVIEADRIGSPGYTQINQPGEVDGVRFNEFEEITQYHILNEHPGSTHQWMSGYSRDGQWISAAFVIHWFRQDRGWLRGVPETAPSLPLCAVLRRYTMAKLRHAETAADLTGIIETEGPASQTFWIDPNTGQPYNDDAWELFPFEIGMIMNLPYGYKIKQLEAVPNGEAYDAFTAALLREIVRPILTPYNVAAGTSKDSNMASSITDRDFYRMAQESERTDCEAEVLDKMLDLWWYEAVRAPSYLGDDFLGADPAFSDVAPDHVWRWDQVVSDHTDPSKVQQALKIAHDKRFISDRDIQERYYNRDVDDWRAEIEDDDVWRASLLASGMEPSPPSADDTNSDDRDAAEIDDDR